MYLKNPIDIGRSGLKIHVSHFANQTSVALEAGYSLLPTEALRIYLFVQQYRST